MSDDLSFEKAYDRLEEILGKMNSGHISLEEALKLYEEADSLIAKCGSKLDTAEKKIQILMKNRDKTLKKDDADEPVLNNFDEDDEQILMRDTDS